MRRTVLVLLTFVLLAVPALASSGKQVRYVGIHPIPRSEGGGICYIEAPHVHLFDADRIQYRDHRGAHYFVGDPVAYGYNGKRYAYKGHHAIHVNVIVGDAEPDDEYCYLSGAHYHYFAPPEGPEFKVSGDAYFYVAEPPRAYVEARPILMKIDAVYEPIQYERPVIEVEAPVGWIGARAEFMAPSASVEVVAPSRRAVIAPPRGGVTVQGFIPTPSIHIGVGVGIGVGAGVIVRDRPSRHRPVRRVKIKRDNGRHRGHR
jgi:hypothetical protein